MAFKITSKATIFPPLLLNRKGRKELLHFSKACFMPLKQSYYASTRKRKKKVVGSALNAGKKKIKDFNIYKLRKVLKNFTLRKISYPNFFFFFGVLFLLFHVNIDPKVFIYWSIYKTWISVNTSKEKQGKPTQKLHSKLVPCS